MPKVSVIMPCLNMVKYISQCLDTVICQTLTDIEILLVDAGSTDGTIGVLQEYAKKDSRIHILHSDKKSYGYQMNLGISSAKGEYIGIVETDDMIQLDMFEVLYKKAIDTTADYVKGTSKGFYLWTDGREWHFPIIPCKDLQTKSEDITSPKDTPSLFLYDNFLWNGIYHRELLQKIRFNETPGAAFQDIGVLFQTISTASKGLYLNHLVYHYRQDNMDASSYNKKSLFYTEVEYQHTEQFLQGLSVEWKKVYYLKMAGLTRDRFYVMAGSGEFWEESYESIEELRKRLQYAVEQKFICAEDCNVWQEELWQDLCMFLESPELLYQNFRKKYEDKLNGLKKLFQIIKRQSKVYLFGATKQAQFLHVVLAQWGMKNIAGYCDNNKELQGKEIQGKKICSPEKAVDENQQTYYVIISMRHWNEMKNQLLQLGVKEELIGVYNPEIELRLLRERIVPCD